MKNSKSLFLILFLLVFGSTNFVLSPVALAAPATNLIKASDSSAVYWIQNGARRPFPMVSVYQSWFKNDFKEVQIVAPADLVTYPLGKNILFKPGSLIKIQTDPKVYLVKDESGSLEWIQSEADFKARGFVFADVRDVPDTFFPDYGSSSPQQNFATPNTSSSSTPVLPPVVVPTTLSLTDEGVSIVKIDVGYGSAFSFSTNQEAALTLTYSSQYVPTSTLLFATSTAFKKDITTPAMTSFVYKAVATGADGQKVVKEGTFETYSDVSITKNPDRAIDHSGIFSPTLSVGSFSIKNSSNKTVSLTSTRLVFQSTVGDINAFPRTVQLVRYTTPGSKNYVVLQEKFVKGGVSFLDLKNAVQLSNIDSAVAAGQTAEFGVLILGLDELSQYSISINETLTTQLDTVEFASSDLMIRNRVDVLSILNYKK